MDDGGLRAAVMICATLVNAQINSHTHTQLLTDYTTSASELKLFTTFLVHELTARSSCMVCDMSNFY